MKVTDIGTAQALEEAKQYTPIFYQLNMDVFQHGWRTAKALWEQET